MVFGLNEFSIRFASALFGSLTIILVFLISLSLFKGNKSKYIIALASALMLAIMPWHVNLSRVGVESTSVVFFISLGVYFYLRYLEGKSKFLFILSFISFGINFFIYQAPRAFLPLFLPLMAFSLIEIKSVIKNKLQIILYLLFIVLPVVLIILSPSLSWRIQTLSIFHHPETKLVIQEQLTNDGVLEVPRLVSRAMHNKLTGYSLLFLDNYFSHLSYGFLFSDEGFPDRFRIPGTGLLYVFQLPLLLISFVLLYNKYRKISYFLFGWVGIAMLGSALTYDDIPNLQRTLIAVPAFAILSGYGISVLIDNFKNKKYFLPLTLVPALIIVFSLSYFLVQYFTQGRVYMTWNRQDGYKELVKKTEELMPNYERAVITGRETGSTLLFLFYSKADPLEFQKASRRIDMSRTDRISYGNFEFSEEECPLRFDEKKQELTGQKNVLYVNSGLCEKNIPGTNLLYVIKRAGGFSEAFHILKVK
ncbi:MAG: PMT family glycosyltransferase, 4-amino-4-deoxy-L-arabinose transferase [uncultured bacterium]|nr:MAG: PMT family glycosyltransferase, 4-amino-4-deoxy-L-arabinose transferase [uncultured bacterium]